MALKRKHRRLVLVAGGMALLGAAAALVLFAFQDNLVFFYSPSEIAQRHVAAGQRLRIGGLVEEGSVKRADDGITVFFKVTDLAATVPVRYRGDLPDLFREGQGVVAEGRLDGDGVFVADTVLAKHDAKYMPPEVAQALKDAGQWKGTP